MEVVAVVDEEVVTTLTEICEDAPDGGLSSQDPSLVFTG